MTQVFGNVIESVFNKESSFLTFKTMKNYFKQYCGIKSELDLDLLCRYVMENPKDPNHFKIPPKKAVVNFNSLLENAIIYTERDFNATMKQITSAPKSQKAELHTVMRIFCNKNEVQPETLLSVISRSKIDFNKKWLLVYLMKKSKSIYKINENVISVFWKKYINPEEKPISKGKSGDELVIAHLNLGNDDNDEGYDKNSLKYKLRKAIRAYFTRKLNEKIEKFTRGQTMFEEDQDKDLTTEEVTQRFFWRLAEYLHNYKMPLIRMIRKYIFDDCYNSQDLQVIYADDFFKSLRDWGITYSQREKLEVTGCLNVPDLSGKFMLTMIDKILKSLGVKLGLPENTLFFKFETLNVKSIRIINRILEWCKNGLAQTEYAKHNNLSAGSINDQDPIKTPATGISSSDIISFIHKKLKNSIKIVEIMDSKGKLNKVEYIDSEDLAKILRENYVTLKIKDRNTGETNKFKTRVFKDIELHENLQFFLCISQSKAHDKIMVKKLTTMLSLCLNNEYIQAVGVVKRPDPKDEEEDDVAQVIEAGNLNIANPSSIPRSDLDEDDSFWESIDLSDQDSKEKKKQDIQQKMFLRRKNRSKGVNR